MAVLNALRRTPSALARNLVLFVPVFVLALFQLPQIALRPIDPLLSSLVSAGLTLVYMLVLPFFQGGLIAMAAEALDGETSVQTFVDEGKANYLSILVAYFALVAVNFVLGMAALVAGLFGGIAIIGSGGIESAGTLVLGIVVVVGVAVLLYLVLIFFLQFYGQAIVLDGFGAVGGLKHSVTVVRQNLVSTLGYSVLCGVAGGLFGGVAGATSLLLSPRSTTLVSLPEVTLPVQIAVALVVLIATTVFGGFFAVYSVAFYRSIAEESPQQSRQG